MNNATSRTAHSPPDAQFSDLVRVLRASFSHLHEHPAVAWMTPRLPVRLLEAGGGESLWAGGRRLAAAPGPARATPFLAVELPPDLALTRNLVLPVLSGADLRSAVALEVRDSNPFEASELVWGYRATMTDSPEQMNVTAVLASRRLVTQFLQEAAPGLASLPEVWVLTGEGVPVVLEGFGEEARSLRAARGRWLSYGLLIVALMLGTAIAVTPTVQQRLRTLQAVTAYQALQQRAGPAVAQREALVRGRENLASLREVMSDHVDPIVAIDMLTQLIPDDTWLQRIQAQGARFTLSGQTPNAAALMNTLSGNPGLKDVRAPSPATRATPTRETFVVEFTVAPELLQRAVAPGAAATGQAPLAGPTSPVRAQQ